MSDLNSELLRLGLEVDQYKVVLEIADDARHQMMREISALEAQLAAADRLAELCEPLMDGTIEVDDAPLHVGKWYTDLAFTIASYRAIRGKA